MVYSFNYSTNTLNSNMTNLINNYNIVGPAVLETIWGIRGNNSTTTTSSSGYSTFCQMYC